MSFVVSKILWIFISPGGLLITASLVGAFLGLSQHPGWQNVGRRLCFHTAFLFFFIAVFPVGSWMLLPLENDFPPTKPEHVDGIILLGGDENAEVSEKRGQPVALDAARRFLTFAALAREYPKARLVYTGGSGLLTGASQMKPSDIARDALASLGVPVDRMTFETESRTTHENAVMSSALVHPDPTKTWLLVTSAWHIPRAMACFRKAGWNVFPASTGYMTTGSLSSRLEFNLPIHLYEMTLAMHEYYGLVAYRLAGYTDTLWPH